ncbi:unnamed protein product [Phaeothamnion confervicola]
MRPGFTAAAVLLTLLIVACSAPSPLERAKALLECNVCKTSKLTGTVDDCCIDFSTVDEATQNFFLPVLTSLQKKTFFKFFKVNLEKQCPFWEEDGQCFLRDCSVCECDPQTIPQPWLEEDKSSSAASSDQRGRGRQQSQSQSVAAALTAVATTEGTLDVVPDDSCQEQIRKEKECKEHSATERQLGKVDHSQNSPAEGLFAGWKEPAAGEVWAEQDDNEEGMQYVNLELNPEKFTGYSGASAQKVWRSIYMENCFGFGDDVCKEKRVFFRLLSGLQSSITTQIANDYRFDDGTWGPNVDLFLKAVGAHPDRLTNLYFAYLFTLRALAKAAPLLANYDYATGHPEEDAVTRDLMASLAVSNGNGNGDGKLLVPGIPANSTAIHMCMNGFDESALFQPQLSSSSGGYDGAERAPEQEDLQELQTQFMARFHNISRIMDCVGCEKCKLWGKLETLGLGTAIKIMLPSMSGEQLQSLNRNELIALVNTAAQLAKSVGSVPHWKWLEVKMYGLQMVWQGLRVLAGCIAAAAAITILAALFSRVTGGGGSGAGAGKRGSTAWLAGRGVKDEGGKPAAAPANVSGATAAATALAVAGGGSGGGGSGGGGNGGARANGTANGVGGGGMSMSTRGSVRQRNRRADL